MTTDEIAMLMNQSAGQAWGTEAHFQRFAYLVAAHEREARKAAQQENAELKEQIMRSGIKAREAVAFERNKLATWMMQHGYTTGHGDTIEDLLAELDWQIAENWTRAMTNGVSEEREACIKAVEKIGQHGIVTQCASAIRARSNT